MVRCSSPCVTWSNLRDSCDQAVAFPQMKDYSAYDSTTALIRLQPHLLLYSHINSEVLTQSRGWWHWKGPCHCMQILAHNDLYGNEKAGIKWRYLENWKEHLHCHKQSLSPSRADIFRNGIVFHYHPFMDRYKLSDREELPHLERCTSCLNSVSHISKAFLTHRTGVWMSL